MSRTSERSSTLSSSTAVDTDVHLSIPPEELAEYLDEPYQSITKYPTYTAVHRGGWNRYMGGRIETGKENVRSPDALDQYARQYGGEERRERLLSGTAIEAFELSI